MDRELYRRGLKTLKDKIKDLTAKQTARKRAMRMPRKTDEDYAALKAAVDAIRPPKPNYGYDISYIQSDAESAKPIISGYLNAYATLRGKEPCHTPNAKAGRYVLSRVSIYEDTAREEFKKACSITTADLSLDPIPVGSST